MHWSCGGILEGYYGAYVGMCIVSATTFAVAAGGALPATFLHLVSDIAVVSAGTLGQAKFPWSKTPLTGNDIIAAFVLFGVCTFLFVVLLCARMLPSSSVVWTVVLLCTQVLLALLVQVQDSTFSIWCNTVPFQRDPPPSIHDPEMREKCPRNFWWFVVVLVYLMQWAVMFLVWPLLAEHFRKRKAAAAAAQVPRASKTAAGAPAGHVDQ